jgi:hypothetical protein
MAKQKAQKSPVSLSGLFDLGDRVFQTNASQNRIAIVRQKKVAPPGSVTFPQFDGGGD